MLKDLIVIDDFFSEEELLDVHADASAFEYYTNQTHPARKTQPLLWDGLRTRNLLHHDYVRYSTVINNIITKAIKTSFGDNSSQYKFNWKSHLYYHNLNADYKPDWLHRDFDNIYAGVIYLDKNTKPESGTTVWTNDGNVVDVESKYNRLVMYNGNNLHQPNVGYDGRLTLTFFIYYMNIEYWNTEFNLENTHEYK